jgi:formate-dependent nitrite reductase membrane component NrfD
VGLGLVVPLALDFVAHGVKVVGAVSAVLVLTGGFILRYVILMSLQS